MIDTYKNSNKKKLYNIYIVFIVPRTLRTTINLMEGNDFMGDYGITHIAVSLSWGSVYNNYYSVFLISVTLWAEFL